MDNFFSQQNKMLEDIFLEAQKKGVFPGAATAIFQGCGTERKKLIKCYGNTAYQGDDLTSVGPATFYDLASLTKPLATLPALLTLLTAGRIKMEDKLGELLQRDLPREKRDICLRQLLGHSAGLAAHIPFFNHRPGPPPPERRDEIRESILAEILAQPLIYPPGSATVYSDLGYILAGMIVEIKSGEDLASFVRKNVYEPLGLSDQLFFNGVNHHHPASYAPGEFCAWRQRILHGEVGDENCALLGGVAGHAGLFGNIGGVASLAAYLLDLWQGRAAVELLAPEELRRCFSRQKINPDTTWALGVDTPSRQGSSGGHLLSEESIGHLGYSGTSFWIDPRRELVVVLLSNRVHPSRYNDQIKKFRPLFHDTVIRLLED